ncbi:hypothetical protein BCR34DRAFT_608388 [Clohesyomyces aquaticus]|uniref:Cytochrome c domain-containing protein n=1 Tax=Clohesyomyces aquaticus TaxID=1231657 RepID=A0A1Y1Y818_9PLEO|nr:hypothetical protein BCR34DRAFT_608388 [Clohesyomyces aquaticus]
MSPPEYPVGRYVRPDHGQLYSLEDIATMWQRDGVEIKKVHCAHCHGLRDGGRIAPSARQRTTLENIVPRYMPPASGGSATAMGRRRTLL